MKFAVWYDLVMNADADEYEKQAAQFHRNGDYSRAEEYYLRALEILERTAVFNTERIAIMRLHHSLGLLHRIQNNFDKAEPHYKRAWEAAQAQFGQHHEQTATRRNYLAALYSAAERYDESQALLKESLAFYEKALGAEHEVTALMHYAIALVTRRALTADDTAPVIGGECKAHYDRAGRVLNIDIAKLDVMKASDMHRALMRVSYDRFADSKFDEAEELFRHALLADLNEIWPRHYLVADSYQLLGDIYRSFGTLQQSELLYKQAVGIRTEHFGESNPKTAASAYALGLLLLDMQRPREAEPFLRSACNAYQSSSETFPPLLANSLQALGKALRLLERQEEAVAAETQAQDIFDRYGVSAR